MQVILLEKIGKLGNAGDIASVKPGYGRNYLIPHGKAIFATDDNLIKFEARREELNAAAELKMVAAKARAVKLAEVGSVTIDAVSSDEGKLFGSVGTREIADAITAAGVEISKKEINMPEGAIRNTGEFVIELQLHTDLTQPITVVVEAQ
jgi:large subunit ribosomal protein L9